MFTDIRLLVGERMKELRLAAVVRVSDQREEGELVPDFSRTK